MGTSLLMSKESGELLKNSVVDESSTTASDGKKYKMQYVQNLHTLPLSVFHHVKR